MDIEIVKILSEEIRETKNLTFQVEKKTEEISALVLETRIIAQEAKRQADASWELVVMTRNQLNAPWWKRFLGLN